MVRIRSQNELVLNLLDFYRVAQPNLDLKPGSVSRDLLVDGPSAQVSRLYNELQRISTLQSLRLALGSDLDKLGSNFGQSRRQGTKASGPALLTFKEINRDIPIQKGDLVYANNGATFLISNNLVISQVYANTYKAIATQYRSDLDLANITDQYAVEVLVEASSPGVQGNISKYNLSSTSISGISNVTNAFPFGGGSSAEDDATFRSRILAVFSGANTGTSVGYKNAALQDPSTLDALVVEPGDVLMTRDGTLVYTNPNTGEKTIISEGSGGKVDVYVLGTRLLEIIESYIYIDKSNTGDPTSERNDFVLGQIQGDENKTVSRRRLENLEDGILPNQPVNNILQVSGSVTGSNYLPKSVDEYGRVSGNYELILDNGVYGGSPWGFDRLRWIDNKIINLNEDKSKTLFNGQDTLTYPNVLKINNVTQRISVVNENSKVNPSDRSIIQLSHSPITNVTRVFNATTGERYIVTNQNLDGSGNINNSGRIRVSGSSLPSVSDTLQVDYTWIFSYDPYLDFDGKLSNLNPNPRSVENSIDWGYSNAVRREQSILISSGSFLSCTVTHPISSVINVNVFTQEATNVTFVNGRLAVIVSQIANNVISIIRDFDGTDLWNSSKNDGSFSNYVIFLPTDGIADFNDSVIVTYNAIDVYNTDTPGSFDDNIITINPTFTAVSGSIVEVNYISNVSNILPNTQLNQLPALKNINAFNTVSSTNIGNQPCSNLYGMSGDIIQNLRQAPSNLSLNISGSISPGVITVNGTSINKSASVVLPIGTSGLTVDLSSLIRKSLGLNSNGNIPSNLELIRVVSVEKVETASNLEVLNVLNTYDLKGYVLKNNNFFKSESIIDTPQLAQSQGRNLLNNTQFRLPSTTNNEENAPQIGDRLRVTFYYCLYNDSENVLFSRAGTLVTNKKYESVNSISISSGFTSAGSQNATLSVTNFNQPLTGSRYVGIYDYTGPIPNERISIRYNLNKLIGDVTLNLETVRPITADVLAKQSTAILVDTTINIVLFTEFLANAATVKQNVQDAVTAALNPPKLNTTIDASDLVVIAQGIQGVDRARVLYFNKANESGSVLSISAGKSEYIQANTVTINIETR
jgi:hypothetical protein